MNKCHVVIQTAFIGDLFLSIPTLIRLKRQSPQHQIILVCKKGLKDFFIKNNIVDHAFEVQKGQAESYNKAAQAINQFEIDTVFCFHQSIRSTLFASKIMAKFKIGFRSASLFSFWKKIFFNQLVIYSKAWPDVIRQMALLSPVDAELESTLLKSDWAYLNKKKSTNKFSPIPEIFQFPVLKNISFAAQNVQKKIALFPGSVWATKKWTHQGFAAVANRLITEGHQVFIMGGPDDRSDSSAIKSLAPQAIDLTGQMSLYESSMFIKDFDLILCNDSAPAHIAAALQRPVLCVFGPTVLDFGFRPWNDNSQVIELDTMTCRPCGPHGHMKCPLVHHDCMKKIDENIVYLAAVKILAQEKI